MTEPFSNSTRLILASTSARRAQLLREAGYEFEVIVPPLHEPDEMGGDVPPHAQAEALSYFKARSVAKQGVEGLIIGADTVVTYQGEIFGKPQDLEDARRILGRLVGTTHQVITGLTVIDTRSQARVITHARTNVTMRSLPDEAVENYLQSGQWKGKAGAYGIQDSGDVFIERIDGSFTNVVGLPVELLSGLLTRISTDVARNLS
ncbi:MAG: Maf family protein [Phycisphaerae bacterium]